MMTRCVSGNVGPGLVHSRAEVLRVDLEGRVLDGDPALLAGETPIHLGLIRAGWAGVAGFHSPAVLAWGTLGRVLPATLGMSMFCGAAVPCFDTSRIYSQPVMLDSVAMIMSASSG